MGKVKFRIILGNLVLGPGKADLLAHISQAGSIAAAARRMDMSYKRAWMLIEDMNRAFGAPVVAGVRGGAAGGGAQITPLGAEVIRRYHAAAALAEAAAAGEIAALEAMLTRA